MTSLIQDIEALASVTSVRPWNNGQRHYINLVSDGSNAARNTKAYIQGSKVVLEWGKGLYSDAFRDAVAELEAFCAARGEVSRLYAGSASWTATIG